MESQRQEASKAGHTNMLNRMKEIKERKLAVVAQMAANQRASVVLQAKIMMKRRRKSSSSSGSDIFGN